MHLYESTVQQTSTRSEGPVGISPSSIYVYTKNQNTRYNHVHFISWSIDILQPHPDCQILYVMGYKAENPAHKVEGSRPELCVGVAVGCQRRSTPNTATTLVSTISSFATTWRTAPVKHQHTLVSTYNFYNTLKIQTNTAWFHSSYRYILSRSPCDFKFLSPLYNP